MPRRSSVAKLPQEVRRWLERSLEESGFGGYELLTELLREKGYEISKTALHRWGQDIERQRAAIKAETEAAKQLTDGSPDDRDSRSEAVLALVQSGLVRGLRAMMLAEDDDKTDQAERVALLAKVGKDTATLARASIDLKKYQATIEAAARKKAFEEAAQTASESAKRQGLSSTGVEALRAAIMKEL